MVDSGSGGGRLLWMSVGEKLANASYESLVSREINLSFLWRVSHRRTRRLAGLIAACKIDERPLLVLAPAFPREALLRGSAGHPPGSPRPSIAPRYRIYIRKGMWMHFWTD